MAEKFGPNIPYQERLNKRDYSFSAQVDDFARESEARLRDIATNSIVDAINQAQTAVSKGGKMRVDTGFLRASGTLSFEGLPSGEDTGRKRTAKEKKGSPIYPSKSVSVLELAGVNIGQTIYFGWIAKYAAVREAYDGFLISTIQNWQAIVNKRIQQQRDNVNGKRQRAKK